MAAVHGFDGFMDEGLVVEGSDAEARRRRGFFGLAAEEHFGFSDGVDEGAEVFLVLEDLVLLEYILG